MPRYFFDVIDGTSIGDVEGTVLSGIEAAKEEAAAFIGGLLKDNPRKFWGGDEWSLEVRDETGLILFDLLIVACFAPILADGGF